MPQGLCPKEESAFSRGYRAGFIDGLAAAAQQRPKFPSILQQPVEVLGLSSRPLNCLRACQCKRVQDVAELPQEVIQRMRNLGRKSGDEIARALHQQQIFGSAWDAFRL